MIIKGWNGSLSPTVSLDMLNRAEIIIVVSGMVVVTACVGAVAYAFFYW